MRNYYIDESGHSGDLIKSGHALNFDGQPIFSLACIGINDEMQLETEIARLKSKHQIGLSELKSSFLIKKPSFISDLIDFTCKESLPFFIEVVDKKFLLCINIVNHHIAPPSAGCKNDFADNVVRNRFADYLYEHAPNSVFENFIAACISPSEESLHVSFQTLLSWAEYDKDQSLEAEYIRVNVIESLDDYETLKQDKEDAHLNFLPLPDDSKHSKPVWMLPNLSSFCNVYARINLFHGGDLSNVRMIHDEQKHFDEIIRSGKNSAESLLKDGVQLYTPYANYNFTQSAPLFFTESTQSSGIQMADVLAGFVMRFIKNKISNVKPINPQLQAAFYNLLDHSNPAKGVGVNLVVPTKFV